MAKKSKKQPVSAFALFGKSYAIVRKNIKAFAILLALPAVASIISASRYGIHNSNVAGHFNFLSGTEPAYSIASAVGAGLIVFVILGLLAIIIQAMLTCLEVEGAKGKTPSLQELWQKGKKYWLRLFGLALVIAMYIIGAAVIGGLVLIILRNSLGTVIGFGLIAAAVIFVLTHYYLAPYALVDEDLAIFAAMETSANLSKKHVKSVLAVLGVIILLGLTGIIPIVGPIISFVLGALYSVAPALRYFELKKLAK